MIINCAKGTCKAKFGFFTDPPPFSATDEDKCGRATADKAVGDLKDCPIDHEMCRVDIDWNGDALTSDIEVRFDWKNEDTKEIIFTWSCMWGKGWKEAWAKCWVGHKQNGEIDKAGNYSCWVGAAGLFDGKVYFKVEDTTPATGILNIDSDHKGATIKIDGVKQTDKTPLTVVLKGGSYTIECSKTGYKTQTVRLSIDPNREQNYIFYLEEEEEEEPPIENIVQKILAVLRDVFFNGLSVLEALGNQGIIAQAIVDLINKVIDFFTVDINKGGDKPVRVLFIGGNTVLATIPGVSESAAESITTNLIDDAANVVIQSSDEGLEAIVNSITTFTESQSDELAQSFWKTNAGKNAVNTILEHLTKAGAKADPAKNVVTKKLMEIFGKKTVLGVLCGMAGAIFGVDVLATWLASDNIVSGSAFPMKDLNLLVEDGTLTKAEALTEVQRIQEWKDYATSVINVSTSLNPLLWLFKRLFMANTEQAQLQIDTKKAQIETAVEGGGEEKGLLTVNSSPSGAKIYIDYEYLFETTNTTIAVKAGEHTLTLKKENYNDYTTSFSISSGEEKTITLTLEAEGGEEVPYTQPEKEIVTELEREELKPNAWKYMFRTKSKETGEVLAAKIYIDDEDTGKWTPYYFYFKPFENHVIRFERWTYKTVEISINVPELPEV